MVKFGRKFFFNERHTRKGGLLKYILIALVIIVLLIVIALIIHAVNKKGNNKTEIILRKELNNQQNEALPDKTAYFKKLTNFNVDDIEITYPDYLPLEDSYDDCTEAELKIIEEIKGGKDEGLYDNPYACVTKVTPKIGSYDVKVSYGGKDYTVVLNVVDTKAPKLVAQNHEIVEGETYKITDFVKSCVDNSKKECTYEYYYDKEKTDFDKITKVGSHKISIIAIDDNGNKSVPPSATLIIKEKPQAKVFTVSFNSDGGTGVEKQSVIENDKAKTPTNPSKEGYTFTGWYLNGNRFDFNTPITSDITLTAGWSKNQAPSSVCSTGDLSYNADKYPYVAAYVTNGNCPISKSDFNLTTHGQKAVTMMNKELKKIKDWQTSMGYNYCYTVIGGAPQGVLNNSGKGYVGYTIQISIAGESCINPVEMARYYIDSNGVRQFSLNIINMPAS